MSMNDMSVRDFAKELAAQTSVPGGGGAAALFGALGAALGSMVGVFTVGKKKYADVESDIIAMNKKAEKLRKELLQCIDDDAKGFEPLSKAYGIPKDAPGRDETMEKCLRDAAAVPMRIAELSCEVIDLAAEYAAKGSSLMISDAGCSAAAAETALKCAVLNVRINTKFMKDRDYAEKMDRRSDELVATYCAKAEKTYKLVADAVK